MTTRIILLVGLVSLSLQSHRFAQGAIEYKLTDLGTFGGNSSWGASINASGEVVGYAFLPDNATTHAFVGAATGIQDLGGFGSTDSSAAFVNAAGQVVIHAYNPNVGGLHVFVRNPDGAYQEVQSLGGGSSEALGFNNAGQVTGRSYLSSGTAQHAFFYDGASTLDLGTLGGSSSYGVAVNDAGHVAGWSFTANNAATHAFIWTGSGPLRDLGTLGGPNSEPTAINAAGEVVGYTFTNGSDYHAFSYMGTGPMRDLGTLGGAWSWANAINTGGQIVGWAQLAGSTNIHAFVTSGNGPMQDLGTLGEANSEALAINSAGQIVGRAYTGDGQTGRAFLYDSGQLIDLNTVVDDLHGMRLYQARGINDQGQIIAQGITATGEHAVLLTPVPEPNALVTLGSTLLGVCGGFWRARGPALRSLISEGLSPHTPAPRRVYPMC